MCFKIFAKKEWFRLRTFGWGLTPKKLQGWVYVAIIIVPFIIFHAIVIWNDRARIYVTIFWLFFVGFDSYNY